MTEPRPPQIIPPRPPLEPRKLSRERQREERRRRAATARAERAQRSGEHLFSGTPGAEYHGHRVVVADDLETVFSEDEQVERARQKWHLLHRITISFLAVVLVVAVVLALLIWRGVIKLPSPASSAAATTSCPSGTFEYLDNLSITVNVFNSTLRTGLAASVAAELKKRGYQVGTIGDGKIIGSGAAVIVSGSAGEAAAFNLQRNLPNTEYQHDGRSDNSVDVYLSSGFSALTKAEKVDHTAGKLSCRKPSATPSGK
ncbi:hypothetical protein FHU41_002466 [Psychromicrobium silvestre]|uniref:LytR/CpsA/Psr regulator C-terminal domain-containing protein n=1 Tax=Psychromicrobium silvestre TaxID=1645614 RepID=A0A7Y9S8Q5_9MICC|nr:LytR C-terminal domain-containing protein [Psychromicrobium silvestre]NYE96216.1 hypothetical protein [Psychromicrobium silvestre]